MANDPTTTPAGEADMPQAGKAGRTRASSRSGAGYRGLMADGDEAQTLSEMGAGQDENRSFVDKEQARRMAAKAKDTAAETLSALTDKVNTVRDQVQSSAEAARDWTRRQAGQAADAAKQLHAERPVLVLSVSAGVALTVGLLAGFVIGRATADDY